MITPDLLHYVQQSLAAGKNKEQIQKDLLLAGGWQMSDIDEVFAVVYGKLPPAKPVQRSSHWGVLVFLIVLCGVVYAGWHLYGDVIKTKVLGMLPAVPTPVQPAVEQSPVPTDEPPIDLSQVQPTAPDPYAPGTPGYTAIESVVKKAFILAEQNQPIAIAGQSDITGDSNAELLIDLGSGVSAKNDYTVIRFENDTPIVARVNYKGKISNFTAKMGTDGSGHQNDTVELNSDDQAIIASSYSVNGVTKDYCVAIEYVWNPQKKVFEYNKTLSDQRTTDLMPTCIQVATAAGVTYKGK